jgi:hypothetical protein
MVLRRQRARTSGRRLELIDVDRAPLEIVEREGLADLVRQDRIPDRLR